MSDWPGRGGFGSFILHLIIKKPLQRLKINLRLEPHGFAGIFRVRGGLRGVVAGVILKLQGL